MKYYTIGFYEVAIDVNAIGLRGSVVTSDTRNGLVIRVKQFDAMVATITYYRS